MVVVCRIAEPPSYIGGKSVRRIGEIARLDVKKVFLDTGWDLTGGMNLQHVYRLSATGAH